MGSKPGTCISTRVLNSRINLRMFGRIKSYVISCLRDLKNEWIHLDKAMQWWLRFVAIVVLSFLVIVTRYIIN
jgi:hypothetical protein